ncbi:Crp/Fnr family transcriptional regulator [Wenyingzhuangia sp. IMCC45533]
MLSNIVKYYQTRGVELPKNEIDIITSLAEVKKYKKKEFLFNEGDNDLCVHYIQKGCVRVFIKDAKQKEYNRFFAFEDWWIGEYHQILNNLSSRTSAQALEKTETISLSKEAYHTIFEKCPVYTKATLNLYLNSYAKLLEKEEIKKTMTIEDLYTEFVLKKSKILDRVPLYHIASYLGVKPESLSRVKKNLKEK